MDNDGLTQEQPDEQKRTDALCAAMRRALAGNWAIDRNLRRDVSDRQLLALALSALVEHGKQTLLLMESAKLLAQRVKENRDEANKNS